MKNNTIILDVENLSKTIKKKSIIHDVSFMIESGSVVGLLGPNGAGKTTIMKMIVGLMGTSSGEITICDSSLKQHFTDAIAEVGAIIENPEFYNYMTGYDNLMQYVRMSRVDISKEELMQIIDNVHLSNNIHQKVKTYSLGMRQRLGVAQAILHNPKLLILDEPMNGLDPQGMHEFRSTIRNLANHGTSVLVSSHILSDMELLCDTFLVIQKGKITHKQDLTTLHETGKTAIIIETDNNQLAKEIIEKEFPLQVDLDKKLSFSSEDDPRIDIVNTLVANKIGVLSIHKETANLEEQFLQWTEKGGL